MKTFLFLIGSIFATQLHAASMETPEAYLNFVSADGHPVAGVALTGILGFSVVSIEDCSGFICVPSLPHRVHKSEGGEVLGKTNSQGVLQIPSLEWSTNKLTAKDLSVSFFTNGTIDVTCPGKNSEEETFAGFVELLPFEINGQAIERNFECTSLEFHEGDEKEILFNCTSPLTMEQIQEKIDAIKAAKCD